VRREHLIVLGVPVNLDDVSFLLLFHVARLTIYVVCGEQTPRIPRPPLSDLHLSHRFPHPQRPDPAPRPPATPSTDRNRFSAPPPLDRKRAEEVCAIREDDLILLSLSKLKALKEEVERLSIEAGEVLTHVLLVREKETGDGETYHRMIQVSTSPSSTFP
jgi:hypothetical protein